MSVDKNSSKYWLKAVHKPGTALNTVYASSHFNVTILTEKVALLSPGYRWEMEAQRSQVDRHHRVIEQKGQELNPGSLNPESCPRLSFVDYILKFKKLCHETHVEKCTDHKYTVQYAIPGVIKLWLTGQRQPAICYCKQGFIRIQQYPPFTTCHSCFWTSMAELSGQDRCIWLPNLTIFPGWPFTEKVSVNPCVITLWT